MIRIMLACAGGMSTSLLVTRMETAAEEQGVECKIWAVGVGAVNNNMGQFDILLLGPQIRYKLKETEKLLDGKCPVAVIDMKNYGTMNGSAVFAQAMELYNSFYNK